MVWLNGYKLIIMSLKVLILSCLRVVVCLDLCRLVSSLVCICGCSVLIWLLSILGKLVSCFMGVIGILVLVMVLVVDLVEMILMLVVFRFCVRFISLVLLYMLISVWWIGCFLLLVFILWLFFVLLLLFV